MVVQNTHVLVVDDEPAICKSLAKWLANAGFRATTAPSGETAMAIVRSEHVDVLVVDLRMSGGMRGDTFFELAAATQPHLRHRTLFTTGDISERAEELVRACRCPMLKKPFALTELVDWVRGVQPLSEDQTA